METCRATSSEARMRLTSGGFRTVKERKAEFLIKVRSAGDAVREKE